jgi:rhomboid protease GluP
VAPEDELRANYELSAYDRENRHRSIKKFRPRPARANIEAAMIYWAVLLFFFAAARTDVFAFDWVGEGATQAGLMRAGEWWRAVTALCLHVSGVHLIGNLVFGTLFLLFLSQVTGTGVAWLLTIGAGAVGNVANALIHSPSHSAIGASTAIFAGVGALAALRHAWRRSDRGRDTFRAWTPLAGGVMLLAFLGFSGENTDILGHVLGFGSGIVAGWGLSKWPHDWPADRRLQWISGTGAGAIVAAAWAAAAFV